MEPDSLMLITKSGPFSCRQAEQTTKKVLRDCFPRFRHCSILGKKAYKKAGNELFSFFLKTSLTGWGSKPIVCATSPVTARLLMSEPIKKVSVFV
jgi:hypothetical protein